MDASQAAGVHGLECGRSSDLERGGCVALFLFRGKDRKTNNQAHPEHQKHELDRAKKSMNSVLGENLEGLHRKNRRSEMRLCSAVEPVREKKTLKTQKRALHDQELECRPGAPQSAVTRNRIRSSVPPPAVPPAAAREPNVAEENREARSSALSKPPATAKQRTDDIRQLFSPSAAQEHRDSGQSRTRCRRAAAASPAARAPTVPLAAAHRWACHHPTRAQKARQDPPRCQASVPYGGVRGAYLECEWWVTVASTAATVCCSCRHHERRRRCLRRHAAPDARSTSMPTARVFLCRSPQENGHA